MGKVDYMTPRLENIGDSITMSNITKPMLAGKIEDLNKLKYPIICSPKYDGIRCLKINGQALTRSFKPIPNKFIFNFLCENLPEGFDGEIIVGKTFQECSSAIMSFEGEPNFIYWAFDYVRDDIKKPYEKRLDDLMEMYILYHINPRISIVPTKQINNLEELLEYEALQLSVGYEGIIIRDPNGPYKCGRSSEKEGWLLKLKRFVDSEAVIIGLEEMMHNENEIEINELGKNKRSLKKAGLKPANTLGNFIVKDVNTNIEFKIGTGLTQDLKKEIWDNKEKYLNKIIKYKYQPTGIKVAPRMPVFLGFRDLIDM
jgi:DNA ligase-1